MKRYFLFSLGVLALWGGSGCIMETNPDNSPVEVPLKEVFHMD